MKINLFVLLAFVFTINFCNGDPVQCQGVLASSIGYYTSCSSTKPFPLKVSSTITLTQRYAFNPSKSWKFYLRNYKGQITTVTGCSTTSPADSTYNPGVNLTVGFTCYEMPRQLQEADVIQISFFDDYSSFRLIFLVPIIGYSNDQTIKTIKFESQKLMIDSLQQKQVNNQQISLTSPLNDIVECFGIQDSIIGGYANCFSSQPFPLKVSTTVTMNKSYGFNPEYSWKFYIRNYKGQLTKAPNCIQSNPTPRLYNKGQNITIGFLCTQLPRQLQQSDYMQISFFDDTSYKLIYLIPIIGYSEFNQKQTQNLEKNNLEKQQNNFFNKFNLNHPLKNLKKKKQVNKQQISATSPLNDIVECFGVQASILGGYANCFSSQPFPLKVSTTVTMNMSYGFYPDSSWKFYIRNYKGQLTKVPKCIQSNPAPGPYNKGSNITIGFLCTQLPRQLQQSDYIQISFFDDTSNKLIYLIPIIGYSEFNHKQTQNLEKNNLEKHQNNFFNKLNLNHPLKNLKKNVLESSKQKK